MARSCRTMTFRFSRSDCPMIEHLKAAAWPDNCVEAIVIVICTLAVALPRIAWSQPPSTPQIAEPIARGSASRGERLFTGEVRFRKGGPSCVSCHSIAGLPFPNGGTLGPDLTRASAKLGPQGMPSAMQTLFFPAMTSIYDPRPLTLEEQGDLITFFQEAGTRQRPRWITHAIALGAFVGLSILLAITRFVWRDRLISVRRTLVEKAVRPGGLLL
jgi:hypothetical protein